MIGADLATTLFGRTNDLVGQSIRINGQTFSIIGVLKSKGGSAVGSSDNQVIIPITTARDRVIQRAGDEVDTIYIQATSAATASQASTQVSNIMRMRHHVAVGSGRFLIFSAQRICSKPPLRSSIS